MQPELSITFMSDTHSKHKQIPMDHFSGGDILIHTGDISSMGYKHEIQQFLRWFNSIPNYTHKVFIAGNHDWGFQSKSLDIPELLQPYQGIHYLRDSGVELCGVKIYGSPWQPEFCDWAFNLPRNGEELEKVWSLIPDETDILLTHGPAYGYVDKVIGRYDNLGCEKLIERILQVKPIIHACGHIHSGNGVTNNEWTTFINSSVLNEQYVYSYKPFDVKLNTETKQVTII
jgi:Icc-related predicted phosphoesterase